MESNGVPGKIHVSATTAAYIEKFHKGHWLSKRPDKVEAKGKGQLQTYFVDVAANSSMGPLVPNKQTVFEL